MVDLDVLVIGGGAQGLWLLNDLTKRQYRAVLLERHELGGGQTCHSHGLIHRGHYYDDVDMMIILNAAAQFWEAFVDANGLSKLNASRALAGFGSGTAVKGHTYMWDTAGLKFDPCVEAPPILRGGKAKHLFETDEFSLDTSEVITGLSHDVDHAMYKLDDQDDSLAFFRKGTSIVRVDALLSGTRVDFQPKVVVFTAGVGNYGLLARLDADTNLVPAGTPVQAQRKNHMLIVRGSHLPMMTAVFPIRGGLHGVFLCPRTDSTTGKNVWLASDHNSTPYPMNINGESSSDPIPSPDWVQRMLISLGATAPELLTDGTVENLEMAVYTGLTSERNFGVGQHMTDLYIDPLGFENLLAIWPTKLTMTPFASNVALRFIRPKVPEPSGAWPTVGREITTPAPQKASEMWSRPKVEGSYEHKTEMLPYREFLEQWHVGERGGPA